MTDADAKDLVLLSIDGETATLTLNRPAAYNAIDHRVAERLRDLAIEIEQRVEIKVVIVRGAGKAFCGGGDIRHFVEHLDDIGSCIRALLTPYHEFLVRLRQMPKISIASVHGSAAGAGLSLVSMCDLAICSEDARFTPAYANIGVSPDGGGTYGLVRAIGARRALQVQLGEESFDARQAADWGLVAKVVPGDRLNEETVAYAARLARTSHQAIAESKRLMRTSAQASLEDHLTDEMESLIRCMGTPMFREAVGRFVTKA